MDAKIVNLQTLFEQQVSYQIPQFQRRYEWKEKRQWQPLWEDVRTVAGMHYLNGEMGTIRYDHTLWELSSYNCSKAILGR